MTTCGEGSAPSVVLPELLQTLSEATANHLSFPELPIGTQRALGRFGIFGSDARNAHSGAKKWKDHRGDHRLDRELDKLGENADEAMAEVKEYAQARKEGTLGLTMTLAWTAVRSTRSSGVYVAFPKRNRQGEVVDGVVTSYINTYTFTGKEFATPFHTQIQALYQRSPNIHIVRPHDASRDWVAPKDPWDSAWIPPPRKFKFDADGTTLQEVKYLELFPPAPRPHTVEVSQVNEYVPRMTNEAKNALTRKELAAIGIILPEHEKVPLKDWLEKTTINPEVEMWLHLIDLIYSKMHESGFVAADYVDEHPDGTPLEPSRREHITATDKSAATKTDRDRKNGRAHFLKLRGGDLIKRIKGDSRYNLEQHPYRRERLWIERGVYLRRPRLPKDAIYYGPSKAEPLNVFERAVIEAKETWREVKENPKRLAERLPEILPDAIGTAFGGLLDVASAASKLIVRGAIASWRGILHYRKDVVSFRQQKKQARARLHEIHAQLQKMQDDIIMGAPDVFPDTSLPDTPQLRVIKQMSAMMLENLT